MDIPDINSDGPAPWVPKMQTKVTLVSGAGTAKQILTANNFRYLLAIQNAAANNAVAVKPQSPSTAGEGFNAPTNGVPLVWTFNQHGVIVCEAWYIWNFNLTSPLIIVEGIWLPTG